jgi:hypothetical protein
MHSEKKLYELGWSLAIGPWSKGDGTYTAEISRKAPDGKQTAPIEARTSKIRRTAVKEELGSFK